MLTSLRRSVVRCSKMRRVALLFIFVFCLIACSRAGESIMLQVEPGAEECFHEDVAADRPDHFTVIFTVTRGGKLDIKLVITGPAGNVIHHELYYFDESREDFLGTYTFEAREPGTYNICFDNKMSRYTAKVISFTVTSSNEQLNDEDSLASRANLARKGDLDPIEWGVARINNGLLKVEQEQSHYRIREQVHRDLADKTSGQLFFFSALEIFVLCFLSGAQIFYLRRWFNKRAERVT